MKKLLLLIPAFLLLCFAAAGQVTNPAPQILPYTQNFDVGFAHTATTYPAGWQGWTISTSPGSAFNTAPPTLNRSLTASGTAALTTGHVYNYNGKIGFLNTGSLDLSIALALNTTGRSNIQVQYDIMTIRNPHNDSTNTRINEVILQYRVGIEGSFINLTGTEYQNNTVTQTGTGVTTPQNLLPRTITLPAAADNQPVVQLRWASREVSGVGSRPSFAVDNIGIIGTNLIAPAITVTPSTLTGFSYVVGSGPSAEQSFTVSGTNLTGDITITPPTANYEISIGTGAAFVATNPVILTQSGGTVPATTLYVRLKSELSVGSYSENISLSSAGADSRSVSLAGQVLPTPANFRSAATGFWSAAATWEASPDGTAWLAADRSPEDFDRSILIRTGHVVTVNAAVAADQIEIQNEATLLHSAGTFSIVNCAGNDVVVHPGGVFTFGVNPPPVFATGATCLVNPGGILRIATAGLTGIGAAVHSANMVFTTGSVLEYTPAGVFSASGVTFFPHVDAATIPLSLIHI